PQPLSKKKNCVRPHPKPKQRKIRGSHSALKKKQKRLHFFYCDLFFFFFVEMILNIWGEKKINGKNIENKWKKRGKQWKINGKNVEMKVGKGTLKNFY
ncbi:hypothetical protein RFI_33252, partial [Reticulomyxa filosa]